MTFVSIVMMDDSIGNFDLELAYPTRLISFSTLSFVSPLMISSVNSLFIEIDWQNKDIWWNDALNFCHSAPSISCLSRLTDKTKIFNEMMHWIFCHSAPSISCSSRLTDKTKIFDEMMHWIFFIQLHQLAVHRDWLTKQRYLMKWCTEFYFTSPIICQT